jgi:putative membrane protein
MNKKLKFMIYFLIGILLLTFILRLFIPFEEYGVMGGYNHHMFSGGFWPVGMVGMGLFWILVILLALHWFGQQNHGDYSTNLDRLKRRLSRGEITVEEYERVKEKMKE